jgi:prepilin-type N-terminal cleavage/methylation domain-containing protein
MPLPFLTKSHHRNGFTLIELLVVIAILVILATIVLIAINPPRNVAKANNAQRASNVNTIINAVHQYAVDNQGNLPATITTNSTEVCKTNAPSCSGLIDLSVLTFEERYVLALPTDPTGSSVNGTGYFIQKDAFNRVTVSAPFTQNGDPVIQVAR